MMSEENDWNVVKVLLDAFFETTTPYCIMHLLNKVQIGSLTEKNIKLREGYLKRLVESGRLQNSCDFNTIFKRFLSADEKKYVAMLEELSDEQLKVVFDYCFYEKQEAFLRKNSIDANQRASNLINAQSFLLNDIIFLSRFLGDHFNELTNDCLITFIASLNDDKRIFYVKRLLETDKLVNIDREVILKLCVGAIGKNVARTFLENEKFFKDASALVIVSLLNLAYTYDESLPRMRYLTRLFDTEKLQVSLDLKVIFDMLRYDEKEEVLEVLKDKELGAYQTVYVASCLPKQAQLQLLQNNIFWKTCYPSGDQEVEGRPLFSKNFLLRNSSSIIKLLSVHLREDKINHFQKMMPAIAQFAKEEYGQDKLVFFHGQHDSWAFLGNLFDALIAIKNGQSVPENFVRLRFQERPIVGSDDEVYAYRERAKKRETHGFFSVLFTTLHLLENDGGSNSLIYVYANFDQKTERAVNIKVAIEATIKAFFTELDMLPEYDALIKETPTLFTDLYDLYKNDVIARGDVGRLVAISMPKGIAQKLAYTADISGHFEGDGDAVRRAKNYCDSREYCVIFGKEMTDPLEAQRAGVRMASFTADANEESLPLAHELKERWVAVLARIARLLYQRREYVRAFRKSCPFALSYNYLALVGAIQKQHHDVLVGQSEALQPVD